MRLRTSLCRVLSTLVAVCVLGALPAPARAGTCGGTASCPLLYTCDTNTGSCLPTKLSASSGGTAADTRAGWAVACAGIGFGVAVFGLLFAAKVGDDLVRVAHDPNEATLSRQMQLGLYVSGGVFATLGGLAIGLQASAPDRPCGFGSECQVTYGLAGSTLAVGALLIGEGLYLSASPRPAGGRAWLAPAPFVIPTMRGATIGVGISGINF